MNDSKLVLHYLTRMESQSWQPFHSETLSKEMLEDINQLSKQWHETEFHSLLQALSRLFCLIERNGDAGDYANRLGRVFKNSHSLAKWLHYYSDHATSKTPFHELCNHMNISTHPFPELWNFGEGNLKSIFSNLKLLETITLYPELLPSKDQLKTMSALQMVKDIDQHLLKNELTMIGLDLETLSNKDKEYLAQIKKINSRFKRSAYENAPLILEVMREAKNSDAHIPSLILKSEEIGLPPGYYMAKLADDDVRSAMSGFFTGCCQRIGGQGADCAIHSVVSPYGCTYAIFRGKVSVDSKETLENYPHDQPLVMSWTWAEIDASSQEVRALGFDSIEYSEDSSLEIPDDEIINVFYTEMSQKLLEASGPSCQKIIVGTHGHTPDNIGHPPIGLQNLQLAFPSLSSGKKYTGYSDARNQFILASRTYSLFYKMHDRNILSILPELLKSESSELKISLSLNYSEEIMQLGLEPPALPDWLVQLREGNTSSALSLIAASPQINFNIYLPKDEMTVLSKLISEDNRNSDEAWETILPYITATDLNVGSPHRTALIEAAENHLFSRELILAFLDKGPNHSLGDYAGRTFVHYFALRESHFTDYFLKLSARYQFDLFIKDDHGMTPAMILLQDLLGDITPFRDDWSPREKRAFSDSQSDRIEDFCCSFLAQISSPKDLLFFINSTYLHAYKKSPYSQTPTIILNEFHRLIRSSPYFLGLFKEKIEGVPCYAHIARDAHAPLELIKQLLAAGIDPNLPDDDQNTLVHHLVKRGASWVFFPLDEILKLGQTYRFDYFKEDAFGITPALILIRRTLFYTQNPSESSLKLVFSLIQPSLSKIKTPQQFEQFLSTFFVEKTYHENTEVLDLLNNELIKIINNHNTCRSPVDFLNTPVYSKNNNCSTTCLITLANNQAVPLALLERVLTPEAIEGMSAADRQQITLPSPLPALNNLLTREPKRPSFGKI